jgi:hypothetical protein
MTRIDERRTRFIYSSYLRRASQQQRLSNDGGNAEINFLFQLAL